MAFKFFKRKEKSDDPEDQQATVSAAETRRVEEDASDPVSPDLEGESREDGEPLNQVVTGPDEAEGDIRESDTLPEGQADPEPETGARIEESEETGGIGDRDKEDKKNKGLFNKLKERLSKTRSGFAGRLDTLIFGKKIINEELIEDLEEILFTSDLGVVATQELIDGVQEKIARKELDDPAKLKDALKGQIRSFIDIPQKEAVEPAPGSPRVVLVIGVNGVGKTTTIGKAGHRLMQQGEKVMLVAADTFRAAATEQLEIWAERGKTEIVKQKIGSDPSAVVFDALSAAESRHMDVVLIDTAGRLHTKSNLMDELSKIQRVAAKRLPGAPHEVWLVLDATTGQNAIAQAEIFDQAIGITHLILTKLDGTAKGGIVVGISHQLKLPIKYIGIGEGIDDLRPFDPSDFVNAIFD